MRAAHCCHFFLKRERDELLKAIRIRWIISVVICNFSSAKCVYVRMHFMNPFYEQNAQENAHTINIWIGCAFLPTNPLTNETPERFDTFIFISYISCYPRFLFSFHSATISVKIRKVCASVLMHYTIFPIIIWRYFFVNISIGNPIKSIMISCHIMDLSIDFYQSYFTDKMCHFILSIRLQSKQIVRLGER